MTSLGWLRTTKRHTVPESYGGKRCVISLSIYGDAQKYMRGLHENCKDINRIYPDFWIYVYVGNDFDHSTLNILGGIRNLNIIYTGLSGHINMSYRFFSIDYPEVGIAFSRDCDCRIIDRDQYCINTFIRSSKLFQIIRDNESHNTLILGGMWGIKKGALTNKIVDLFDEFKTKKIGEFGYGDDQIFLSVFIYPRIKKTALIFDERFHFFKDEEVVRIDVPDEITEYGGLECVGRPL